MPWLPATGHSYSDVQRVKTIGRNEQFCTVHTTAGTLAFTPARFGHDMQEENGQSADNI